ncbi:hypothetical protein [Clostridium tagluense]|uniref:hypothetical protein n=1 Tax=Clostridium tagluense TaxID=360422 RepID=UPI001C6F509B|nr:hypothetical protein [Clostridium tagluense]MBW9157427.1 hypothetical protein [Clostridium tagluense]WLC66707.1 hypothetical protein KTC93_05815 [Clostridium tagluense]
MDKVTLKASLVIGIIGVILISVIYFRPVSIERNYSAYIYAENSEFQKPTEIKLVGELKKKLSLNYVFTGSIEVDGIKQQVILKRICAKNNIFKSRGYSAFIETKNSKTGKYEVIGTFDTSKDFNEIIIRHGKVDSKYNGKFNICGPSSTREEAKAIATNIGKDN